MTAAAVLPLGAMAAYAILGPGALSTTGGELSDGVKEITIRASAWQFSPRVVQVEPEDTVRFSVQSDDMNHGFAISELNVNLPLLPGKPVRSTALDVRLPPGRYTIHCSVFCGTGHQAMKARLVVGGAKPGLEEQMPWLAALAALFAAVGFVARVWTGGAPSANSNGEPRGPLALTGDLTRVWPFSRLVQLPPLQFLFVLPTLVVVAVVLISTAVGIDHPALNFGMVFTWVAWWGLLLVSLVFVGRLWCFACPVGAIAEWVQRLSLWWRSSTTAGYGFRWPKQLRGLWLATGFFVVFVWLDSGYGVSNNPRMTAGLIVALILLAAWVNLFFERRAFCRYVCPITSLLGLAALVSTFELRRANPATCRTCVTKDCFRGNDRYFGCPMGEYPGGRMDTNLYCTLCTECVKSCRYGNISMRFRPPGQDLWTLERPRADEAYSSAIIVGVATLVPLMVVVLLPSLRRWLLGLLPAGTPPNDLPRLVAVSLLFVVALAGAVGLAYGFSGLSVAASEGRMGRVRTTFMRYAYALLPISVFRLLADFADTAVRAGGTLAGATRGLVLDFPFNRVLPDRVPTVQVFNQIQIYGLQVVLVLVGLVLTLLAMHRISLRLFAERETALASFIPMAGLALLLAVTSMWTLGIALR